MSERKKHVLIVMVGISPAVITETVYALCKEKADPPDEVIVYTTSTGKKKITQELFNSQNNVWIEMLSELGQTGKIKFGIPSIKEILIAKNGITEVCNDITSDDENKAMADFLLQEIRGYTDNPGVKISFSIAGGRKSMSAMGALVMSLVGRHCDKLYHILVEEGFENPRLEPPFFYPKDGDMYPEKNKRSCDVKLSLMEIPVVLCRYWFHDKYKDITDYTDLVNTINRAQIEIKLDFKDHSIMYFDQKIKTNFLEFLLYRFFVERYKENEKYVCNKKDRIEEIGEEFDSYLDKWGIEIEMKSKSNPHGKGVSYHDKVKQESIKGEALRKNISKLNAKLTAVSPQLKISQGTNNWDIDTNIPKDSIKFINQE